MPVINVDGVDYIVGQSDLIFFPEIAEAVRKNRREGTCPHEYNLGVDINRNFGFHFSKTEGDQAGC